MSKIFLPRTFSWQVTDTCLVHLTSLQQIKELNIFHTSLTNIGHAHILKNLENLEVLDRGDFLCDALEYIETEEPDVAQRCFLFHFIFWVGGIGIM